MSLRRHILQVVALVTAVALVFGAFAGSATAKKMNKKQKAKVRAELRKQVKKNPGVVKRRAFLKKAALVNFKLPVTIRLRTKCDNGAPGQTVANPNQNTYPLPSPFANGSTDPDQSLLSQNCATSGTALNQKDNPSARVNLGPSLGSRDIGLSGALAAVVEFSDTYDGGALGNVNLKILPGNKTIKTSSVPLLWNDDIADTTGGNAPAVPGGTTRSEKNFATANAVSGGKFEALGGLFNAYIGKQGCGDWTSDTLGGTNRAPQNAQYGAPADYKGLFWGVPYDFDTGGGPLLAGEGLPGYPTTTALGVATGVYLPRHTGVENPLNIISGTPVTGNNDYIGPNPNPFPTVTPPAPPPPYQPTNSGNPAAPTPFNYQAANTVLRTNALELGIAPGGVNVDMSSGTSTPTSGGLTTAQGSQDVTLGYSGGQANLFGNIPGKNVGIDVTVNLQTKINSIVRIVDQDLFKNAGTVEGEDLPAGLFNCRQIFTGAVQNYIPGVRLTGSLRIAPAITKDGKVRIAKATVQSDVNNPDRVALSACLFPAKPYLAYETVGGAGGPWNDNTATKFPIVADVNAGIAPGPGLPRYPAGPITAPFGGIIGSTSNALPIRSFERRYPNTAEGNAPSTTKCGTDAVTPVSPAGAPGLAAVIRNSGLTGTVSGLPTVTDPAYAGLSYKGDQASVAGDITVNPIDVDVLLGDQPVGT